MVPQDTLFSPGDESCRGHSGRASCPSALPSRGVAVVLGEGGGRHPVNPPSPPPPSPESTRHKTKKNEHKGQGLEEGQDGPAPLTQHSPPHDLADSYFNNSYSYWYLAMRSFRVGRMKALRTSKQSRQSKQSEQAGPQHVASAPQANQQEPANQQSKPFRRCADSRQPSTRCRSPYTPC